MLFGRCQQCACLLLFKAGIFGLLLGCLARALRAERLTGAVLLALGTWGWTYASVGVSLLVVRQIPAHHAFTMPHPDDMSAVSEPYSPPSNRNRPSSGKPDQSRGGETETAATR